MKMLWSYIKLQKDYFLFGVLVVIGTYAIGNILHDAMIVFTDDESSVFCLGSVMAAAALVMMMCSFAGTQIVQAFHYAVAMGRTRKQTFPLCMLDIFLTFFILELLLKMLNALEKLRLGLMYPDWKLEDILSAALAWKYLLAYALVGTAFSMFLGAMISRFGKGAYVAWYLVIMLLCIGGPRLYHYLTTFHSDSQVTVLLLAAIRMMFAHTAPVVAAVTVIFAGAGFLMLRRQQVSV